MAEARIVSEAIGPRPEGGYPVPERPIYPGPTRERWLWTAAVAGTAVLIVGLLVFGGLGGPRPDFQQVQVADVLTSANGPAGRFGSHEIQVIGWYAAVTGNECAGSRAVASSDAAWLAADCPLRVLLPNQPIVTPTQAELLRDGLRLAAPNGQPFPPPAAVGTGTAGLEQLVFDGHFDDAASRSCATENIEQCRNTFVVSGYVGLIR
jgi:hypothetical protein